MKYIQYIYILLLPEKLLSRKRQLGYEAQEGRIIMQKISSFGFFIYLVFLYAICLDDAFLSVSRNCFNLDFCSQSAVNSNLL